MDAPNDVMRFTQAAIVLRQPWMVALFIVFVVALLVLRFAGGPDEAVEPTGPRPWWVWPIWLLLLAALAVFVWLLGHAQDIVVDGAQRRVTTVTRFLTREVARSHAPFDEFTAVRVLLKLDSEHRGSSMPTGGATLGNARTVTHRSFALELGRADIVLETADKTLRAPRQAVTLPLDGASDPQAVEAVALRLARLGGWPALRRDYRLEAAAGQAPRVRVIASHEEPIPPR
jgi:hypothetical protein